MQNVTQANCLDQILEHNTVQPIVHVRGDSETELDLLFSVLNNNEPKLPGQPYRNKNLPLSFFQPPGQKFGALSMNHSRDGSHEFPSSGHMTPPQIGNFQHSRSHSSPAQLPIGLSLPPPNSMANCSVVPPPHLALDSPSPLQQRWTNNKHNINNNVWPCDYQQQMLQSPQQPRKIANIPTSQMKANSDLGALPPGWEQGLTAEGDVYFIDHINKTTSWNDPRLSVKKTQNSAITKVRHPYVPASRQHMQSAQQRLPHNTSPATLPPKPTNVSKNKVNLHQQFMQQIAKHNTPNNQQNIVQNNNQTNLNIQMAGSQDIGLMNNGGQVEAHALQASSIGVQLFGPPSNSLQALPSIMTSTSQSSINPTEQRIRIELEKLRKEKERLSKEQEANNRREQMLLQELVKQKQQHQGNMQDILEPNHQSSNLIAVNISGIDPFMGQTPAMQQFRPNNHVKQNSGDSSLGSCYSRPRSPDDFSDRLSLVKDSDDLMNIDIQMDINL